MYSLTITAEYRSPGEAEAVYSAVSPDDDDYVTSYLEGSTVRFQISAENAGSMRSAMDDVLACVKVAEAALGIVSGSAADLDGDALREG